MILKWEVDMCHCVKCEFAYLYGGFIQTNDAPASIVTFNFTNKTKATHKRIGGKRNWINF